MATEVKHAIRTPAGWSANQSAMEALYGVDGYYTLLSLWEDDIPADLVAPDERWIAECYNDWPAGLDDTVDITSHITAPTQNIVVRVASGEGHGGIPGAGFYMNPTTGANHVPVFRVNNIDYIEVDGIEAKSSVNTRVQPLVVLSKHGVVKNLIVDLFNSSLKFAAQFGTGTNTAPENTITVIDTLVIHRGSAQYAIIASNYQQVEMFNCIAVSTTGLANGFSPCLSGGYTKLINCVAYNCDTDYSSGLYHADSDTCASSSATASETWVTVTSVDSNDFVASASDDYHITETSRLRDSGLNLIESGDLLSPQYDIDGDQWPDTGVWDIGFDYFVGGGGSGIDINVPKSDINLTSFQPVVNISQHITAEIPQHNISINSYPPAVVTSNNISLDIPAHDINLLSYAPSIATSESIDLDIPLHNININSHAPIAVASNFIDAEIPDHNININSHAPVISLGAIIENIIPAHNINITGYAPDVAISEHINSIIPEHDISLISYAPEVLANSSVNAIIPNNDIQIESHIPRVLIAGAFTTAKERIYGYPAINRIYTMTRR